MPMGSLADGWDGFPMPQPIHRVWVEVAVETLGTLGAGAVCELVSWSVAGSGVVWVVGTVETLGTLGTVETGAVCWRSTLSSF